MKRIIAAVLALALCFSLGACMKKGTETETGPDVKTGTVYFLNYKPEADKAWQAMANKYAELKGITVKVITPASGEYDKTLAAELEKESAPTLFQVSSEDAAKAYGDYCYDLKGSKIEGELTTDAYNLYDESGKLCSIGYCYECYGIIVNRTLLEKAGYKIEDIKNFASLKAAADDIHARNIELGFDAFTSSGLDLSSSWRFSGHLANLPLYYEFKEDGIEGQPATIKGTYLDYFRNVWDLYISDSATRGAAVVTANWETAQKEFCDRKAVFYQNGSWEYDALVKNGLKPEELAMIPIYCGAKGEEKAGLCCGTENYWAVNGKSSKEDIDATLDFLYWMVTSPEGTKMMAEQFGPCPFKEAATPENVFFANANDYTENGNYVIPWLFNNAPSVDEWRKGVIDALVLYTAKGGSWEKVKQAFVDGWAQLYAGEHA